MRPTLVDPGPTRPTARVPPALRWLAPLLLAAVALSALAAGDGVLPGDVGLARAIQLAVLPAGRGFVEAINWLGQAFPGTLVLCLAATTLLLRAGHSREAITVAATLPLRLLNPGLKALIDSPRPTDTWLRIVERAEGFGFPSGHASGAILFYGALIAVAPCLTDSPRALRLLRTAAALMILVVGVSRIAVGAHWPSDVLGGYLWGGVLLGLLLIGSGRLRSRRGR